MATPGRMPLPPKPLHKTKMQICYTYVNILQTLENLVPVKYLSHSPCPGTIPPWYNPGIPTPCLNAEKKENIKQCFLIKELLKLFKKKRGSSINRCQLPGTGAFPVFPTLPPVPVPVPGNPVWGRKGARSHNEVANSLL